MIHNYYTLLAIARSIHTSFAGWTVHTPFTQRRNELVIPVGPPGAEPSASIVASCEPSANFLIVRSSASRASRNSADIFPGVTGRTIVSCRIHPSDRVISLTIDGGFTLLFRFFGSQANVLCLDPEGALPDAFLRSRGIPEVIGYPFPDVRPDPPEEVLQRARSSGSQLSVEQVLRKAYPTLGPLLVRELLFRTSVDPASSAASLPDAVVRSLARSFTLLIEELSERPSPRILKRDDEPLHFALVSLHHLGEAVEEPQTDISKGILRYLSTQKRQGSFLSLKKHLLEALDTDLGKTTAAQQAVSRSLLDPAEIDLLERYGKILHMHLADIQRGMAAFTAKDPYERNTVERTIPLDPSVSPVRNAERYFDKAKNARKRKEDSEKRLSEIERRLGAIRGIQRELEDITDSDTLQSFIKDHKDDLPASGPSAGATAAERAAPPFRVYTVQGGFQVWVGKNSANNDLLTTRHTAKEDLWFHARGVGGSHVVLKVRTGKGEVPKQAKIAAAAIAAHYSKMKNARHVPVSMCLGKFVRKPRKAQVGTVTIEREEVIFVDPALPPEERSR